MTVFWVLGVDLGCGPIHYGTMSDDTDNTPPDNETMREVKRAKARKAAVEAKKPINWKAAAGVGVGSAALLAALIYANKARKKDD
jgi:hypothetical protein